MFKNKIKLEKKINNLKKKKTNQGLTAHDVNEQ